VHDVKKWNKKLVQLIVSHSVRMGKSMNKWILYAEKFVKNKVYMWLLAITAVCSYGFVITHGTVGIDDTPYAYYFEEGLAAIVGRWVLFLLNKVVHVAEFAPFLTDLAAVLILLAAVIVWSMLLYSVLGSRTPQEMVVTDSGQVHSGSAGSKSRGSGFYTGDMSCMPMWGYFFFAAIFISCPLISEVFTYYLHNGIAIGYLCCGISLCCFREGLFRMELQKGRKLLPGMAALRAFLGTAVFLWIALGCYESFMIVWLLGIFLLLLTERLASVRRNVFQALCLAAVTAMAAMVLRSVMIALVTKVFGLEYLRDEAVQRSITEMAGWLLEPGAKSEFAMVLKRIFVMYGVFGYAYYPIKIFLLASVMIVVFCLWRTFRQKDGWILLLMMGSFVVSFLLVVIEGKATLYRSAQFLPVICGYGALLLVYGVSGLTLWLESHRAMRPDMGSEKELKEYKGVKENGTGETLKKKAVKENGTGEKTKQKASRNIGNAWKNNSAVLLNGFVVLLLGSILWNQCTDMNRWFYVDYMKYEAAKDTASQVAHELQKHFDTSKPVVFTGTYEAPKGIIQDAYVEYNTPTYYKMKRITDRIDKDLLDKFNRAYGVWVAQTPSLSVIDWGKNAFGNNEELIKFFSMHGYTLQPMQDEAVYPVAEQFSATLPEFPAEGAIVDRGEYIIVHF